MRNLDELLPNNITMVSASRLAGDNLVEMCWLKGEGDILDELPPNNYHG